MSNIAMFGSSSSSTRNNMSDLLIKITCGNVLGFTKNIKGCPSVDTSQERGSIVVSKNLNRIIVESVSFDNGTTNVLNALILDPPNSSRNHCCSCCASKQCICPLSPVENGQVRSFTLNIPANTNSLTIVTRAFHNWRYGSEAEYDNDNVTPIERLNCFSSYQDFYRFAWIININNSINNVSSKFALGPYINCDRPTEICIPINNLLEQNTQDIQTEDIEVSTTNDNLFATAITNTTTNSSMSTLSNKRRKSCCIVEDDDGEERDGVCVQPFYVNASIPGLPISTNADNASAGCNGSSPNVNFLGQESFSQNTGNLGLRLTTSATFSLSNRNNKNDRIDSSNLLNLNRPIEDGVLTLFTN